MNNKVKAEQLIDGTLYDTAHISLILLHINHSFFFIILRAISVHAFCIFLIFFLLIYIQEAHLTQDWVQESCFEN